MFITPAYAQTSPGGDSGFLIQLVPFILIFIILYFLIIRPQQRRTKEHQAMIGAIRRGDTIVTSGGLIGRVVKVIDDRELFVEIAANVKVKISRGSIAEVRTKGEPVKEDKAPAAAKAAKTTKTAKTARTTRKSRAAKPAKDTGNKK